MTTEKTKTPTALMNEVRMKYLEQISDFLMNKDEDVLEIAGNKVAFPVTDSEGNELWVRVTVEVPRGEKDKETGKYLGYDGYQVASDYEIEKNEKEAKKIAAAKKKAEKEAKKNSKSKKSTETTETVEE